MKEDFKKFVRKRPELAKFVNNGKMTWQKFYDQWKLYGDDSKVWNEYNEFKEEKETKEETFSLGNITDLIKKIDMNSVQKGVNSLQKVVELLQGLSFGETNENVNEYKPRQLYKKFED